MPSQAQVSEVVDAVKARLEQVAKSGVRLKVSGERLEDDWLYVVITPDQPGISASDHARLLSKIEKELREQGYANILLVPAIDE